MANRSSFPNSYDIFTESYDISPTDAPLVEEWQDLKKTPSLTPSQQDRLNQLTVLIQDKILSPEKLNKLQDAMSNMQLFVKQTLVSYYRFAGTYSASTTYTIFNSVKYNGEVFLALQTLQGVTPVDDGVYWMKMAVKGDKGDQGVAGLGLSYIGDYNNGYAYAVGNAVTSNNVVYYCIQANTGQPVTNTSYWKQFFLVNSSSILITDAGNVYNATNVETALQEVKTEADNILTTLGTATLSTTSQTIKGAINEVNTGVNYLKGGNPNLLKESSFQFGGYYWTDGSSGKLYATSNIDGSFLTSTSSTTTSAITYTSSSIPITANTSITISADFWTSGLTAGNFYIVLKAYNGSTFISNVCTITPTKAVSAWSNINATGTTPANTTQIYAVVTMDASSTNTNASVRRIKIEKGSTKTPYSDESDVGLTYNSALHIANNANTDGYFDKSTTAPTGITRLNYSGYFYATRVYNAVYGDYAEYLKKGEYDLKYGDVISIDTSSDTESYIKSTCAYDKNVVGVYSDDFGHILGGEGKETDDEKYVSVGMAGTVRVKVIGEVRKGDLLVSSDIRGVAMSEQVHIAGTVFAKALDNHEGNSIDRIRAIILNC